MVDTYVSCFEGERKVLEEKDSEKISNGTLDISRIFLLPYEIIVGPADMPFLLVS